MRQGKPEIGRHDYFGSCRPGHSSPMRYHYETFSVGIFKWVPAKTALGRKRSKVVYRVRGLSCNASKVYERAEIICDMLDSGVTLGAKSEWVP